MYLFVAHVPSIASLTLAKTSIYGGNEVTGTVNSGQSLATARQVTVMSDKAEVVATPAVITIPAGEPSASFKVRTTGVGSPKVATLTARVIGTTTGSLGATVLNVLPAVISRIEFAPAGITMSQATTGTVHLDGTAPPGGVDVYLTLDPKAPVDLSDRRVHVDQGQSKGTFSVTPHRFSVPISASGTMGSPCGATASLFVGPIGVASIDLPDTVIGGWSGDGYAILDRAAPVGGYHAPLVIEQPTQSSQPVTATATMIDYPQGTRRKNFSIETRAVPQSTAVTISVGQDHARAAKRLVVRPVYVESLAVEPAAISPGHPTTLTITLESNAPEGGLKVTLTQLLLSGSPLRFESTSIDFPAGTRTNTVKISCGAVLFRWEATVIARVNGISKAIKVTVNS